MHSSSAFSSTAARSARCRLQCAARMPGVHALIAPPHHLRRSVLCRIGFQLGDSEELDGRLEAERLMRLSTTLLLYTSVLTTPASKHFLACLRHIADRDAAAAQQAYSSLWHACSGTSASWADFVQDQVMAGRENRFAQAWERRGMGDDGELAAAAEHDLAALQQLAVGMHTLVRWIEGASRDSTDMRAWSRAAAGLSKPDGGEPAALNGEEFVAMPGTVLQAPPSADTRAAWKRFLFADQRWSDAASALGRFYARYGVGLVGQHAELLWNDGFQAPMESDWPTSVRQEASAAAVQHFSAAAEYLAGTRPAVRSPVAVISEDKLGCSPWRDALGLQGTGCRIVHVAPESVAELPRIMKILSKRKRCRFVIAIRGYRETPAFARLLDALQHSVDGVSVPGNVLLALSSASREERTFG